MKSNHKHNCKNLIHPCMTKIKMYKRRELSVLSVNYFLLVIFLVNNENAYRKTHVTRFSTPEYVRYFIISKMLNNVYKDIITMVPGWFGPKWVQPTPVDGLSQSFPPTQTDGLAHFTENLVAHFPVRIQQSFCPTEPVVTRYTPC